MKFTKEIEEKIKALKENINNRNHFGIVSYRDSFDLNSILNIIYPIINSNKATKDDLYKSISVLSYVAAKYEKMPRYGEVVDIYFTTIKCISLMYNKYNELHKNHKELIKKAIISKQRFIKSDRTDIINLCQSFLKKETINLYFANVVNNTAIVKNDPVEMSNKYIKVIDIVEEKLENELNTVPSLIRGMCYVKWDIKKKLLKEYGIDWKSPKELNPHIIFD